MRTISTTTTTTSTTTLAPMATTTSTTNSPWHSPIPYLFGGLAAMLGLIAFALLMLACSYWRLASQSQTQNQEGDNNNIEDLENKEGENEKNEVFKGYEEKILVIMAGDQKPTFLATPVCHVYGKHNLGKDSCDMETGKSDDQSFNVSDEKETLDKDNNNHVVVHVTTTQENNEGSQENQQEQEEEQQNQ